MMLKPLPILLLLLAVQTSFAQRVSVETASRVAENFHIQSKRDLGFDPKHSVMELAQARSAGNVSAYYVFNSEDSGFVLVSGNYSCHPVLGFSTEGTFDPELVPPALAYMLDEFEKEVASIEKKKSHNTEYLHLWEKFGGGSIKKSAVEEDTIPSLGPLLKSKWAQGCYYNSMCPEDPDGPCDHVLVGCVAIAIAQVMNYWEYPARGSGTKTYRHDEYGWLSADFGSTDYHWPKMPDKLKSENEELARFLYHCAVVSDMDFGPSGSGAYTYFAVEDMVKHFDYSTAYDFEWYDTLDFTWAEWGEIIRNDLDQLRPVIAGGPPPVYGEGHAYVIDGYYGDDQLHYNWGWGGSANGYYRIGGEEIYYGIQPKPCYGDTLIPNPVVDLFSVVENDSIKVMWNLPAEAIDGDYATKYNMTRDGGKAFFVYDTLYGFPWDTMGTYHFTVQAYDDCMHPSDSIAELEVTLFDTMNFHPRITDYAPSSQDTVAVYPGVYKIFQVESTDPNHDTVSFSWTFNGKPVAEESSSRLALNVSGVEPGIYPLQVLVSDHELTRKGTWRVQVLPGDSTFIDDCDSIFIDGSWISKVDPDAYGGSYQLARRNIYYPSAVEYVYFPEKTGTYDLSVYIPFIANLSVNATYTVLADEVPVDTFRISQRSSTYQWTSLGCTDLPEGARINLKVEDYDRTSPVSFLVIDAIRFTYLGVGDFEPPQLLSVDTLFIPEFLHVSSSEEGMIYLVPDSIAKDLSAIRNASIDSATAFAGIEISISLSGLENGVYWIYARDSAMNLSEHGSISITGVGIPGYVNDQARIYPNPASETLTVEAGFEGKYTISILSVNGKILSRTATEGPSRVIDISFLGRGVYFINIRSDNHTFIHKLVKL